MTENWICKIPECSVVMVRTLGSSRRVLMSVPYLTLSILLVACGSTCVSVADGDSVLHWRSGDSLPGQLVEITDEERKIIEVSDNYSMTGTIRMWALLQSIKNVIQNKNIKPWICFLLVPCIRFAPLQPVFANFLFGREKIRSLTVHRKSVSNCLTNRNVNTCTILRK